MVRSLWDWGTKSRFLLIIINCKTTIDMSFLNTHPLCYKTQYSGGANFGAYTDPSFSGSLAFVQMENLPGSLSLALTVALVLSRSRSRSRSISLALHLFKSLPAPWYLCMQLFFCPLGPYIYIYIYNSWLLDNQVLCSYIFISSIFTYVFIE